MTQTELMQDRKAAYLDWIVAFVESHKRRPTHAEYLASRYWKARRQDILDTRGHHCERCGAPGRRGVKLDVHHQKYDRKGFELDADLIVLCYRCHMKAERGKA
jgi:5-methylcytosine-specific restriction endonuclease McrA